MCKNWYTKLLYKNNKLYRDLKYQNLHHVILPYDLVGFKEIKS